MTQAVQDKSPPQTPLLNESSVDFRDPEKGQAVRSMFAGIAPRYDLLNHLLSFNRDKAWRSKAVAFSGAKAGDHVLDVCCGTGDLSLAFWRAVAGKDKDGRDGRVVGSDFTPEMVKIATRKSAGLGDSRPAFSVADTLHLPSPDGRFDICSVGFGIRNVQDVAGGVREMTRVVRSGGQVVVLEFTPPRGRVSAALCNFYNRNVLPRVGALLSRSPQKAYSYLPDSIAQFPNADDFSALMLSCGLVHVRYMLMHMGMVAVHVGLKP